MSKTSSIKKAGHAGQAADGSKKPAPAKPEKRILRLPKYQSFKLQKRIKAPQAPLASSGTLFKRSLGVLFRNWKLFLGIMAIYAILNLIFIQGFKASADITGLKQNLEQGVGGDSNKLAAGLGLFSFLLGSSGGGNSASTAYQALLIIVVSLAVIWALREIIAGNKVRIRDGFYKGMYPLIPFILVMVVLTIELLPLASGIAVYNLVSGNGIMVGPERAFWMLSVFLLAVWTLYMFASSLMALYIVTLPDMGPWQALKTARNLVMHRRWAVLRRIFLFLVIILVLAFLVTLPFIWFAAPVAPWAFTVLSLLGLAVIHSYLYSLYRELLQ